MKYCKGCNQEKELSQFNKIRPKKSGGFTYSTLCNACNYAKYADYYSQHQKEKIRKKRETVPDGRTLNVGPRPQRPQRVYYRTCRLCGETKPVAECEGRYAICKACFPQYSAEVYQRHKEYYAGYAKKRWAKRKPVGGRTMFRGATKVCKTCGKTRPREEFPTGALICQDCFPAYRTATNKRFRKYYQRKTREYKARKLGNGGSHTDAEWEAVKAQYNHTCLCCGRSEPEIKLTRDHVLPITKGGTDNIDNIQPLCLSCNCSKNDKSTDYR